MQSESCFDLVGILEEAFQSIGNPHNSAALRDLSILFYMRNIESTEMTSFKTMIFAAGKLKHPQIIQLLLDCYHEAKEDKVLPIEITANDV